ncbi:MAG: response regulator [Pseudomonadota bacterium]
MIPTVPADTSTQLPALIRERAASDPLLLESLANVNLNSGPRFLDAIADWLRRCLDIFAVSIGDINGTQSDLVNVRGFSCADRDVTGSTYPLLGAPCFEVIRRNAAFCVTHNAAEDFPQDQLFADLQISSYVGVPLTNYTHKPIGIFCAFARNEMERVEDLVEVLQWLAPRVSAELTTVRGTENIKAAVTWLDKAKAEDLFRALILQSTHALQLSSGFVAQWDEDDPDHYTLLTAFHAGEDITAQVNRRQPFADSPCSRLKSRDQVFLDADDPAVQQGIDWLHPFTEQAELGGYLAYVLRDADGHAIGHMGWTHTLPMSPLLPQDISLLVFRGTAAAEISRMRAERERTNLAEALMVKDKLESLGLMAGAIAHDFNNLLVTIIGNANLAMDHTSTKGRKYLTTLEQAGIRAGDIVKQLLTYAGERSGELQQLDLTDVVQESVGLLELSKHPKAQIRYQLADDLPGTFCDHAQLQQIIINLVLNAVEALAGEAGDIQVSTYQQALTPSRIKQFKRGRDIMPGNYVVLEVSDSGAGMDSETLTRMFDPFFTNKPEGRGLGMAVLQGFASAFSSGIEVQSTPGQGTCIRVYLKPGNGQESTDEQDQSTAVAQQRNADAPILVIDDEQDVRLITAKLLESLDYEVESCASGDAALELISSGADFSLAFIDVSMPGLNGWQTLEKIRGFLPSLSVVMMSGYTEHDTARKDADGLQASFLAKPFRRHDLANAIAEAAKPVYAG